MEMLKSYTKYEDILRIIDENTNLLTEDEQAGLEVAAAAILAEDDLPDDVIEDARGIAARHGRRETDRLRQSAAPGWDPNDRIAIETALSDLDPDNPIALAVAERIRDLTGRYWLYAEKLGHVPTELVLVRPKTALDEIAYRLHLEAIADATGRAVTVVWVDVDDMPTNQ
ncbi:hypothetical protein [Amorphus sp. MBR-141]